MDKLRKLAKINKRSVNKEIEYLIECRVFEYEKLHGAIKIENSPL